MFVARGVFAANPLLMLVEPVEVLPEIPASGSLHLGRQILDALLDRSVFLFIPGLLAVAEESTPLCQMIERPSQQPPLCAIPEVEPFGQCHITVVVGISIFVVVGPLPAKKFLVERVLFFLPPQGELFLAQRRAEIVADEFLEQLDLSQASPKIVTAQSPGIRPILDGRFFIAFVAGNPLLKDFISFVQLRISVLRFVDKRPSQ